MQVAKLEYVVMDGWSDSEKGCTTNDSNAIMQE